jgi:Holliday junction resolvase RusA-like endonuclease
MTSRSEIVFQVPGIPAPGGSKRHIGGGRIIDDCKRNGDWRAMVGWAAKQEMRGAPPMDGPLGLRVIFWMPRPKSHFRTGKHAGILKDDAPQHHTVKPDATKLLRSTEDALTCIAWTDDARIAFQHVEKRYGPTPGAEIRIWCLASAERGG